MLLRKDKDMTAMNRLYQFHSERKAAALVKDNEHSFDSVCSFKAKLAELDQHPYAPLQICCIIAE